VPPFSGLHVGAIAWAHNDPEIESMIDGRVLPLVVPWRCVLLLLVSCHLSLQEQRDLS